MVGSYAKLKLTILVGFLMGWQKWAQFDAKKEATRKVYWNLLPKEDCGEEIGFLVLIIGTEHFTDCIKWTTHCLI